MRIPQLSPDEIAVARRHFERNGYVRLEGAVPAARLAVLAREIRQAYQDQRDRRSLFEGGGNLSGHLNCFPGEGSRFVWDALRASGVADFVQSLSAEPLRMPNIGCNLNLPGSHAQNEHIDGFARAPFLIVNVAAVDTTLDNGAMEILPHTHQRAWQYWEVALLGPPRRRPLLLQGDAIVRLSRLWHRGMPNASPEPRPMLAFTWEEAGSTAADPYAAHEGRIAFLPNRFRTDWSGRLAERAFVAARVGTAYHIARSLLASKTQ